MPRRRYIIRPLDKGLSYAQAALHSPAGAMLYPAKDIKIDQHSAKKRWGYSTAHRTLTTSADVLNIIYFKQKDGTEHTLYLTGEDLCEKKTGTNETFKYSTKTIDYNSTIASVTSATDSVVTGKAGTTFSTDGVVAGDFFILDTDDLADANKEVDTSWLSVKSVDTELQLTLNGNYATNGTTGSWGGSEKNALIRQVYTAPADEYWSWAIVNDILHFSNGNTNVQKWTGSGYATDLDATNAVKARYLIEYANRLIMADYGSTRDPCSIQWSKNLDPTNWVDASAGSAQLLDSPDYITGLVKVGAYLVIFKEESYHLAHRTGIYTEPINIPIHKKGVGAHPWSIVSFKGTVAWLGRKNFYRMDGTWASEIGNEIKDFFFEEVTQANAENTYGFQNLMEDEIIWLATTTNYGRLGFVWRYRNVKGQQWFIYDFNDTIKSGGRGA